MKLNPQILTIVIAALSMAADAGATIGGLVPPTWGLVVAAVVAGLFALVRALHAIAAGESLKTLLTSVSSWTTALVILASIATAATGVVPVTHAAGVAAFAALMQRLARLLQSTLQPAGGDLPVATPKGLGFGAIPSTAQQKADNVVALPGPSTPPAGTPRRGPYGPGPGTVAVLVLAASLLWGAAARAQTPSDVAPPLSFCFGATTTCVVPDSGLQAVNYDLIHKQWSGGITGAGIGYALLYKSETPYASGVSVHVTFNFNQAAPSFLAPTFAVVVAHYFEAGYTPVFYDGRIGQQITLMVGLNAETLTALLTGKRLDARLAEARAAASGKAEAR